MASKSESHFRYWKQHREMQVAKHAIVKAYLNRWLPIVSSWAKKIVYVDTHAGRGRHESGEPGSPLVALHTLLNHTLRERILSSTEVQFVFVELDHQNLVRLEEELHGVLPHAVRNVTVTPLEGDSYAILSAAIESIRKSGTSLAPSFIFLDPFNYNIPGNVVKSILSHKATEVLMNVMWYQMRFGMSHLESPQFATTLDEIFLDPSWRNILRASHIDDEQAAAAFDILRQSYGSTWTSSINMCKARGGISYFLAHFSNHEAGRRAMKEAIWSLRIGNLYPTASDLEFKWRETSDQEQEILIGFSGAIFDPLPLERWLVEQLNRRQSCNIHELRRLLLSTPWIDTHLNKAIKNLYQKDKITVSRLGRNHRLVTQDDVVLSLT